MTKSADFKDEYMTEEERQQMNALNAKFKRIREHEKKIEKELTEYPKMATELAIRILNLQPKKSDPILQELKAIAKMYGASIEQLFEYMKNPKLIDFFKNQYSKNDGAIQSEKNVGEKEET